ncbi:bifunctional ADP-dependent NAD(P)H-hydrate dehydratase/NAD(P)H-hydrate epimerase [Pseudoxanthomonas kalamensis DSM 18571]|uniref:NAD(P)H-hydrate dehydratase n=1 Tax=Pseudoxanthomonas kalamensis TaxID=289483 RepID=UPI0013919654|nr:NAD(P)H-hydrate dehydratase [Pseudoxanthomonas kalamensis]KAF1709980.1 bifunctional ADP-dependent NAD(P)H-hydrate dehydratase/NAD(P)H-hydrate epimerase [Pseudoxanthomonas kalamensis DSM 18571]
MHGIVPLYDTAAARRLDAQATALLGGDGYALMQRAGQAGWQQLLQRWPQAQRIVVVCGPGNNGGDGYVLAKLALQSRRQVRVLHLAAHAPRTPLAQRACTEYLAAGGRVDLFPEAGLEADVIVDALFGIGLSRAPEVDAASLIEVINTQAAPVFALDVPTGVDADAGIAPGAAVTAAVTLQFIVRHRGLHTGDALERTGELLLDDLQVPDAAHAGIEATAGLLQAGALSAWLPPRRRNTHKGESGRVLCIGGDHGHGGAILLCAEAALRCGTGLLTVATRERHVPALLARRPEAMAVAVESGAEAIPLLAAADVVAVGPGLGMGEWGRAMLGLALEAGKPLVLDADALNLLAEAPQPLDGAILTPHPGEAARLLGTAVHDVQCDRFAAAQAIAERHRAVTVLKGAGTIVAAPAEIPRVVGAGNPGMAVGGMGDLLTGAIAALRGQGLSAFDAASAGALLHSLAGDAAAVDGQRGLLPSDLLPQLRRLANP